VMDDEGSPVTKEDGAPNAIEVPRPEEQAVSSSSGGSCDNGPESDADMEEGGEAVDPRMSCKTVVFEYFFRVELRMPP
jgi:hypothetical protein